MIFPRVFVFTSVFPTKSSRVPTHTITFCRDAVELLMTRVLIFTNRSVGPSEKVFCKVIRCPETVNTREATMTPCPTVFVVSLLSTIKPE